MLEMLTRSNLSDVRRSRTLPIMNRLGVSIAVLSLLLLQLSVQADASNDGMIDPDNVDHYVDRNDLDDPKAVVATDHGIAELNRTKMDATLTGSGDVEVFDHEYGSTGSWRNILGRTTCVNRTATLLECDVYELSYNLTYMSGTGTAYWNSLACHEFGHTAGLDHERYHSNDSNDNSCMRSDIDPTKLDDHDIGVINSDV